MAKDRGIVSVKNSGSNSRKRRTRLMLIGINEYQHWPPLHYPVSDCEVFFEVLKKHYGFSDADLVHSRQKPLYDDEATGEIIYDELYRLADKDENGRPHIGSDENLIIYFAGHGHLDSRLGEGYWAPWDAPVPQKGSDLKKLLSVSDVVKILSSIPAYHIVLIVDACFPQSFARMTVNVPNVGNSNVPEEKPSRWVLTSGRIEKVQDKSPFAKALCDLLETNEKPSLSIVSLGAGVMEKVRSSRKQNAWSGSLTEKEHDGGEFFFYRKTLLTIPAAKLPAPPLKSLPERMRQESYSLLNRLKAGRFKHLRIEKLLLADTGLSDLTNSRVRLQEELAPIHRAVTAIWEQEQHHVVILGKGGMGKTVSLLQLWEDNLHSNSATVPVFVALNEYNNVDEKDRIDFVLRSIARNCGLAEALTDDWKNALWEIMRNTLEDGSPSLLLLLDGFNEITVERTPLLLELNRLSQDARGVQMVVSSRHVEIRNFQWAQKSKILELQPLPAASIQEYLRGVNLPMPEDDALQRLLGIPMMLTIYAGSSEIASMYGTDPRFRFLPSHSVGELLWNFTEAQLVKFYADFTHDLNEQIWHRFLMRCLLPFIAFKMEEQGRFSIANAIRINPGFNFKKLLEEAFSILNTEALTDIFPEFEGKRSLLGLSDKELSISERESRNSRVREYLVDKLCLLVQEGEEFRFLHQDFRDFFAACHLLNMVDLGLSSPAWTSRALPAYLRLMLGQIEGEHHYDPLKVANNTPMDGFQWNNRLAHLLDIHRGTFHDEATQTAVMNVVKTLADVRGTLAGADLKFLDLKMVNLNNILLSNNCGYYHYLSPNFDGALISGKLLFGEGHASAINKVSYGPDDKTCLTFSFDKTIKIWSLDRGICTNTFHEDSHGGMYSPDGKKFLTFSFSGLIKEISPQSGECLRIYKGHTAGIASALYSPDGLNIISASGDHTLKIWSIITGECLRTVELHEKGSCISISPDSTKCLTGFFNDKIIKEWSIVTGQCLQTYEGHIYTVACLSYSPDGRKFLSGSYDRTIKEWSVETGECVRTLEGHMGYVCAVTYSPDGQNILSGSDDRMIIEWSAENGERIRIFSGNSSVKMDALPNPHEDPKGFAHFTMNLDPIRDLCYSSDGKRFISGYWNGSVREWSLETGDCLQAFDGKLSVINSVSYGEKGNKLLVGGRGIKFRIEEWLRINGIFCVQILLGHVGAISQVSYDDNNKEIYSGSHDFTLKTWSLKEGKCIRTIEDYYWAAGKSSTVLNRDFNKALSTMPDGTFAEFKLTGWNEGEIIRTFESFPDKTRFLEYSLDGNRFLVALGDQGTIAEWSAESDICLQTFEGHKNSVGTTCYNEEGSKFLSGSSDKTIKEWSVQTGECLHTFEGHKSSILSVCYSPDEKKVLSGGLDGTVREWSTESGECIQTLRIEPGFFVQACDFSRINPDSVFTDEEKASLRQYGAIFNSEDKEKWDAAIAEARKYLDDIP